LRYINAVPRRSLKIGGIATALLSLALLSGLDPPTEFKLFSKGKNESTKGNFLFDDVAAKSVMSEYEAHGVDLMIDYDHASLSASPVDPANAGKAAAWFNLELRNGELWAVNVRWTEPADGAIRRKEWRYFSPAFTVAKDGRVGSLLNVAVTNIPALHGIEPLVAASKVALDARGGQMDPKVMAEGLDALIKGDAKKCMAIFKSLIVSAASGGAAPETEDPSTPPPEPPAEMNEIAAASARLMKLTSAGDFMSAVEMVDTFRKSHLELEVERARLSKEREVLDSAKRRKLGAELVTLGGKAPAHVWADEKCVELKSYLAKMPMGDLEAFVADAVQANRRQPDIKPPQGETTNELGLSPREIRMCSDKKIDPKKYAETKARLTGKA